MSQHDQEVFEKICQHARQTALLSSVQELLAWDERTMMPPGAAAYRAEQSAYLAGMVHRRSADPQYGQWLGELAGSSLASPADSDAGTTIRRLAREHQKAAKMPQSLVEELARAAVLGEHAWAEARQKSDFAAFRPFLDRMLHLKRQQAQALGYTQSPYDALLDEYEPEATSSAIGRVLSGLRDDLVPLVAAIRASGRRPDRTILARHYPVAVQEAFGRATATRIGFDFNRGRLDPTVHPFCASMGPSDCRITTRYNPQFFNEAFFGILHEAGHAIYDQGLRSEQYGLPPGQAVSLGIHESQSRFWENVVGRGRAFWEHLFPEAQRRFPAALAAVPLDDFYFAVNDVQSSLIRVEADEATYNLHILIRFELENALLTDQLPSADLPGAWAEAYEKYLGIRPGSDREGVLQDVHWSAGLIGYFPTYALGNLCAAQLAAQADQDLGGLNRLIAQGQFAPLREWLGKKVHQQGQRYSTEQLIQRVTGKPLSHQPLIAYLRGKLGPLYCIAESGV
jgi:carboxypeptidase Taq